MTLLVIVSLSSFALACGSLFFGAHCAGHDRCWLKCGALLTVVGAILGLGYRVLTEGVVGANIGWGLFELVGVPVCVYLIVVVVRLAPTTPRAQTAAAPPADRRN